MHFALDQQGVPLHATAARWPRAGGACVVGSVGTCCGPSKGGPCYRTPQLPRRGSGRPLSCRRLDERGRGSLAMREAPSPKVRAVAQVQCPKSKPLTHQLCTCACKWHTCCVVGHAPVGTRGVKLAQVKGARVALAVQQLKRRYHRAPTPDVVLNVGDGAQRDVTVQASKDAASDACAVAVGSLVSCG